MEEKGPAPREVDWAGEWVMVAAFQLLYKQPSLSRPLVISVCAVHCSEPRQYKKYLTFLTHHSNSMKVAFDYILYLDLLFNKTG